MFTSPPEKSEPEVFGLVLAMDTAYYEGMKAESVFDKFLRGLGKVTIIIAIVIVVVVVGVKREEAKARNKAIAIAETERKADPLYGVKPNANKWTGEVPIIKKWIEANTNNATPFDWWGPYADTWTVGDETKGGWKVSVAYIARDQHGSPYTVRRIFYLRGERIIATHLIQ